MYSLTRNGLIYFTDEETGAPVYLCGSHITYLTPRNTDIPTIIVEGVAPSPRATAYYNTNIDIAITVWEWYSSLCEIVPAINCSLSVPIDITIGSTGFEWAAPSSMSIGSKRVRASKLSSDKPGIYWEGVDADGNNYTTDIAVTPNTLAEAPKPILKEQSAQEWAFKLGTLCGDVKLPAWTAITSDNEGYKWVYDYLKGVYNARETLDAYFRLGTHCKWGTPFKLVHSSASRSVNHSSVPYLSAVPEY